MAHFRQLETKLADVEARHKQREADLQSLLEKTRTTASSDLSAMRVKYLFKLKHFVFFDGCGYNAIIEKKNAEINSFRAELDHMLQTIAKIHGHNAANGVVYVSEM